MKTKLLIISFLFCLNSFGQKLPTTNLCLSDIVAVTGGTCLSDAFTNANPAYFDATYATAGNCLSEFKNYGPPDLFDSDAIDQWFISVNCGDFVYEYCGTCYWASGDPISGETQTSCYMLGDAYWVEGVCGGGAAYHMIEAQGAFTSEVSVADANAQRDAYGQSAADAMDCVCNSDESCTQ